MAKKVKSVKKTTSLQWDESLKKLMEERAERNDRSLNNEIVRAIKFYLAHAKTEEIYVSEPQVIASEVEVSATIAPKEIKEEKPTGANIGRFGRIGG